MRLTLQHLRQGQGEETPEFSAILVADGVSVATVSSEGRGGAPRIYWMHPREDEGSLPIDRKGILAEIVKRTLKQLRDPALARVIKQSPEEALMFVPEVIPVEKPKRMASAQRVAARFQDTPNDLAKEVISFLKAKSTKTGGNFRTVDFEPGTIDAEPSRRQRLDAYGNDGEGWDEDAWESEYASPLRNEVEELLNRRFPGNDFIVDIEGKGFVFIQGDSLKNGI